MRKKIYRLAKQFKQRATTSTINERHLCETAGVVTLATGVVIPISIALASTGLLLGLGSRFIQKTHRNFNSKAKKHDKIKTLAGFKLDSISGLVSKAIEDANISHEESKFILKEIEYYRKMKEENRTKSKKAVDAIITEQREEILKQGREEWKQAFLAKIAASFDTLSVNATRDSSQHPICED